ncbi:mechanosensitive ion channel family protein [Salinisphaera sp. LB1]|uniref:mechanosensitive ion channel family protein n=1 Tax=Salinisphaera sp. LB1 TaxID=2183911 RepID=UPI000D705E73|nr:mechanosensitive ion channel domain-containing protein [Salinisphaera sp. LB1]AWN16714.1 Small-conductance mechanosensitive channel [Salinisphaera sp. LB1]
MAGANDSGRQAAHLIHNLQDINFLKIALIVSGTAVAIVVIRRSLPFLAERGPNRLRLFLLGAVPILRLALLAFAILWLIPIVFNVTFQNFLVIMGAASLAIGFAFKDYVSSLIAGIVAIFERPYRPGDWVKLGDTYGEVLSVGLRAVRINTPDDNVVTAPHDTLWNSNIANANDGSRTLMCVANFYVAPAHDAQKVRAALHEVALTSAYLEYDKPIVVVLSETPWGTHYKLRAYPFDMRDQFLFISDMTVRGKAAITALGARAASVPAGMAAPPSP